MYFCLLDAIAVSGCHTSDARKSPPIKTVSLWTPEWSQEALDYRGQSLLNLQNTDDGTVFTPVLRAN